MAEKIGESIVGIGMQYGDEGKIKIFDRIADEEKIDVFVRFNGGANAGHHLKIGDVHIVTHTIPCGIHYPKSILYIGSGTLVNPIKTNAEIEEIEKLGLKIKDRLKISAKCSLVQPSHILFDEVSGKEVGTTGNGIGPAYADQCIRDIDGLRKNIRLGDYLANPERFVSDVRKNLIEVSDRFNAKIDVDEKIKIFDKETKKLEKYLCKDALFLDKLIHEGKNLFFEGANAVMLDVITGSVPYVTSSRTIAAAAYTGGDLSCKYHTKTIGIAKAIVSRVGNGPFVSEFGQEKSEKYCKEERGQKYVKEVEQKLYDSQKLLKSKDLFEVGIALRMLGDEYGATTKRPRRIGMLDLVMLRQNCRLNGVDGLYINKFDCLTIFSQSSLPGIPIVVGYTLDGKEIDYVPSNEEELRRVAPKIEYFPNIKQDLSKIRSYEGLPEEVKSLIKFIENNIGVRILGIGVGKSREEFIRVP